MFQFNHARAFALLASVFAALTATIAAAEYPDRIIKIVVAFRSLDTGRNAAKSSHPFKDQQLANAENLA
jgi:hypothetical protein